MDADYEEDLKMESNAKDIDNTPMGQYTKLYNALKDLEDYNCNISIPEFVFIGFQSSGKTSAVSQAAKIAVGTMKHGTASRCPTRFKLISNPKAKKAIIKVNGQTCSNHAALTRKTMALTKKYEEANIFSKEIIEVRIESSQVAELTFVDLPGLIKGNAEQYAVAKRQLDELTAHFLHDTNPDGTYRYMPILVREPVDVEHDTHFEVSYIDKLVQKYGHGRKKRINWRDDTLFVVNKFDKQINRSPASALIEYMNYICEYGETVITILNAKGINTANAGDLNEFVKNVPNDEEEKWQQVFGEFANMDDECLYLLKKLKEERCGVPKMNEILANKMCEIVKGILPNIERQLRDAEKQKRAQIASIMRQIEYCDPVQLRSQCLRFNNRFLKHCAAFYVGISVPSVDRKYHKTWAREVDDFYLHSGKNIEALSQWQYEIVPSKLQTILTGVARKFSQNDDSWIEPLRLLKHLKMELVACSAITRIIDAWACQVSLMPFPDYTDEDLVNISGGFHAARQADIWVTIRNVVLNSAHHFVDAIKWLAEMMRYKLKENADVVFEYTLKAEFSIAGLGKDQFVKLTGRTLRDYKKQVDVIIDEFIAVAANAPIDQAKILDKGLCEETINIGKLVKKLYTEKDKKAKFVSPKNKGFRGVVWKPKFNEKDARMIQKIIPKNNKSMQKKKPIPAHLKKNTVSPPPPMPIYESGSLPNISDSEDERKEMLEKSGHETTQGEILDRFKRQKTNMNVMSTSAVGNGKGNKGRPQNNVAETPYNMQKYDQLFYQAVFGQKENYSFAYQDNKYDIKLIRHLSYVFWATIKNLTTRDALQKVKKMIMAPIKQMDDRFANAVSCGVDDQIIQNIVDGLCEKSGVDVMLLTKLIEEKSTIKAPKSINNLDNDELQEIYGVRVEDLIKESEVKIKELREFQKLKKETLVKIHHIKNGEYHEL